MTNSAGPASESGLFSELSNAIRTLQCITISQNMSEHTPFTAEENICPILTRETNALSKTSSTPYFDPQPQLVIDKWKLYSADSGSCTLSGRDYKRFCWTPTVVSDVKFRDLVITRKIPITLNSLRGLLYSYHEQFTSLCRDGKFSAQLRQLIADRSIANNSIKKWHEAINCVIGEKSPRNLAKRSVDSWILPEQQLESLELNATTEFAQQFASELAALVATSFDSIGKERLSAIVFGIVCSPLVSRAELKSALAKMILSKRAELDEEIQSFLIDLFLKTEGIGDPRIYPENWAGIREDAKSRVIQWLSREDINFFFELLLRDRDDKHGRKGFWLQYVEKVSRSRALISSDDLRLHAVRLREMKEKGRSYGQLTGGNSSSSFVLDFGRIVVVEFSEIGNACYFYEKEAFTELFKNFWATDIPFNQLKNRKLATEHITRSMKDWRSAARQILARYGVRRG